MNHSPILVIGATGKTGSRIIKSLAAKGFPVRPGSRNSAIPFDWERPGTWAPALEGVKVAYVSYFPDLAFPGAAENIEDLTRAAAASGVRKLVLLSGRGKPTPAIARTSSAIAVLNSPWFAPPGSPRTSPKAICKARFSMAWWRSPPVM